MKRKERIEALKKTSFELFPDASTELEHENEFQLLIAILMSAQATDKQVNIINRNFFQHLKQPEEHPYGHAAHQHYEYPGDP